MNLWAEMMNAMPPPGGMNNGSAMRDPGDEKMDQIRELLIGEYVRASEARIVALEARVNAMESSLVHRIDAMAARIEALAGETEGERRTAFKELASSVIDLGERIRRISKE